MIAISGHHCGRARTGADRSTNRRTLRATQNASDDGASDRSTTDLGCALTSGRIAFAKDRLGVQRQSRSIRKDDRRELDAKTCALTHLAANVTSPSAFAPAGIATRSPTLTSRVTRATTLSSTCALSLVTGDSSSRPITESAATTSSS